MKKTSKKDKINLLFSAFLIIAFVVCGYFFSTLADTLDHPTSAVVKTLVYVFFGLVLFYATRVGEGKQIIRFSPYSLILVILPTLYIILASLVSQLPLYDQISQNPTIVILAGVALGYGLPYTFVSGFELDVEEEPNTEEFSAEDNEEESEEVSLEEETPVEEEVPEAEETPIWE